MTWTLTLRLIHGVRVPQHRVLDTLKPSHHHSFNASNRTPGADAGAVRYSAVQGHGGPVHGCLGMTGTRVHGHQEQGYLGHQEQDI